MMYYLFSSAAQHRRPLVTNLALALVERVGKAGEPENRVQLLLVGDFLVTWRNEQGYEDSRSNDNQVAAYS